MTMLHGQGQTGGGATSIPSSMVNGSGYFQQSNSPTAMMLMTATTAAAGPFTAAATPEEITTLFVVGFPEDMQEREFQNMFLFCPGFEAATLKVPTSALLSQSATATPDEDMSAGTSLLASATTAGRKQIIGFVKFHSRAEALDARDVLNGRRIDFDRGSILKAEMAKKNLHTRRFGSVDNYGVGAAAAYGGYFLSAHPGSSSLFRSSGPRAAPQVYDQYGGMYSASSSYESPFGLAASYHGHQHHQSADAATMLYQGAVYEQQQQHLEDGGCDDEEDQSAAQQLGILDQLSRSCVLDVLDDEPGTQLPISKPVVMTSSGDQTADCRNLGASALSGSSSGLSMSLPSPALNDLFGGAHGGFESAVYHNLSAEAPTFVQSGPSWEKVPLFAGGGSFSFSAAVHSSAPPCRTGPSNDQNNPPCNTLYVGNLPPNTSEDELRMLFAQCAGYKRLLFRSKTNGPMCFVEFESVTLAMQAMQSLHGHPLSTSTKGGIRLSFSKNPLGVRSTPMLSTLPGLTSTYNSHSMAGEEESVLSG